ncbi:YcxB family protein [Puerhibacterium puerhi]|uniref:YcxB family protein n=1 Tax=Puerhibacterium puerhi TaxID=2692623 RepID=UPI00135CD3DB|nr:YcxB family protein [Puerhibacterium puerhi]
MPGCGRDFTPGRGRSQARPLRTQAARTRAGGAVLVAALPVLLTGVLRQDWVGGAAAGVVAAAAWRFAFPRLNGWVLGRTLRRLAAHDGLGFVGTVRLTIDDAGLREELAGTTSSAGWDRVDRIEETDAHAFVFVGPLAASILPKRDAQAARALDAIRSGAAGAGVLACASRPAPS